MIKLKLECEINPEDLTETCHQCQHNPSSCTVGMMTCPWAASPLNCKDITEEHWEVFIRNNLDMDSLFRS